MNEKKMMVEVIAGSHKNEKYSFPFNPTEYSESLTNRYKSKPLVGLKSVKEQFENAEVGNLSLNLLFDTTDKGGDVRDELKQLEMITKIDSELHAPPPCRIAWSSFTYQGVVTQYNRQFTYFYSDGTPARARVTLTLKPYESTEQTARKNKLNSSDVTKQHRLKEGESLFSLAYAHYDVPTAWREIAEANNIDDPLATAPGSAVTIPPRRS